MKFDIGTNQYITIDIPEVANFIGNGSFIGQKEGAISNKDDFGKFVSCNEIKWGVDLENSNVTEYPTAINDSLDFIQFLLALKHQMDEIQGKS